MLKRCSPVKDSTGGDATRQQKCFEKLAEDHERLRIAFERFVQFLLTQKEPERARTEGEAIAWLIQHMQTAPQLPSLSEVARQTGIPRRQLSPDRWPRFRRTYDQIAGLERGVDRTRMVAAYEEEEE